MLLCGKTLFILQITKSKCSEILVHCTEVTLGEIKIEPLCFFLTDCSLLVGFNFMIHTLDKSAVILDQEVINIINTRSIS